MSDLPTPRTDAVVKEWPRESFGAMAELARQLERELAAAEQRAKAEYQRGREDEGREYDEIMQACKTFGDLCRAIEARGKE